MYLYVEAMKTNEIEFHIWSIVDSLLHCIKSFFLFSYQFNWILGI